MSTREDSCSDWTASRNRSRLKLESRASASSHLRRVECCPVDLFEASAPALAFLPLRPITLSSPLPTQCIPNLKPPKDSPSCRRACDPHCLASHNARWNKYPDQSRPTCFTLLISITLCFLTLHLWTALSPSIHSRQTYCEQYLLHTLPALSRLHLTTAPPRRPQCAVKLGNSIITKLHLSAGRKVTDSNLSNRCKLHRCYFPTLLLPIHPGRSYEPKKSGAPHSRPTPSFHTTGKKYLRVRFF